MTLPGRLAKPSRGSGGMIPLTVEKAIASGYAENQGALLQVSATNTYEATGSDPVQVAAVALTPGGADTSGFNIVGRREVPPLFMQGTDAKGQQYLFPYMGTVPAAVDGSTYGATRDTDGYYKIDFNKIGGAVFNYHGFPDFSPESTSDPGETGGQDTLALVTFVDGIIQPLAGV